MFSTRKSVSGSGVVLNKNSSNEGVKGSSPSNPEGVASSKNSYKVKRNIKLEQSRVRLLKSKGEYYTKKGIDKFRVYENDIRLKMAQKSNVKRLLKAMKLLAREDSVLEGNVNAINSRIRFMKDIKSYKVKDTYELKEGSVVLIPRNQDLELFNKLGQEDIKVFNNAYKIILDKKKSLGSAIASEKTKETKENKKLNKKLAKIIQGLEHSKFMVETNVASEQANCTP